MKDDPKGSAGILGGIALMMIGFFGGIVLWGIYGWKLALIGIPITALGIVLQNYGHRKNEQP